MAVSEQRVREAAAGWVWVPDDAVEVRRPEYRLIRYPDRICGPGFLAGTVAWCRDGRRPPGVIIDEVGAQARAWGLPVVGWWVSALAPDTEHSLQRCGARLMETTRVLAHELGAGDRAPAPVPGVTVRLVDDAEMLRLRTRVLTEGWGQPAPDEAQLAADLEHARAGVRAGREFTVVALIDGEPAGSAGVDIAVGAARLWGGVTLPRFRGRGAYGAVLRERLALAADHGADIALVKARVDTSAPILRRAGFSDHGEERRYELTI